MLVLYGKSRQAGMPTRYGCAAFSEAPEETRDAALVAHLRALGACPLGKAAMTELALFSPAPTSNAVDATRTAGGSSCGSAVAVALGMADLALGTQTGGSIARPAAFNGVVGLKPTFGVLPTAGLMPVAPSLDTCGLFARTVADAGAVLAALLDGPGRAPRPARARRPYFVAVGFSGDAFYEPRAEASAKELVALFAERLARAGTGTGTRTGTGDDDDTATAVLTAPLQFPPSFRPELAHALYLYEAGRNLRGVADGPGGDRLSPQLQALLAAAARVSFNDYLDAVAMQERCRSEIDHAFAQSGADLALCLNTQGVAPKLVDCVHTNWPSGDPFINAALTLFGVPALVRARRPARTSAALLTRLSVVSAVGAPSAQSVPVGREIASGMPLSVQIIAPRWRDLDLVGSAGQLLRGLAC
jgi:Asp-tRNA(Asn)/Glu-tRNA(Gln) amidotransferase A subunit family amidase